MNVIVFSGPSLPPDAARRLLPSAECPGPARCGDLYLAAKRRPAAIILIDGYFDHELSVWHKEVLFAVSEKIAVYGAASMGALRAAELHTFGMVGVGSIFEQFRDGELEDDDEVAVIHESAERGFAPRSDAMVNIRATLRAGLGAGTIDSADEAAIIAAGKAMFYPDRTLRLALETAELSAASKERARRWVAAHGLVDRKRADAVSALQRFVDDAGSFIAPRPAPAFRLERTNYWCALTKKLERRRHTASPPTLPQVRATLTALAKQDAARCKEVRVAALTRAFALALAKFEGLNASQVEVQAASEHFRRQRQLLTPEATAAWLAANDLDVEALTRRARDDVLAERYRERAERAALEQTPAILHVLEIEHDDVSPRGVTSSSEAD